MVSYPIQLSWTEAIALIFGAISFALNIYQFLIWRKENAERFRPIYNSLLALFNDIKTKENNVFFVQGTIFNPNSPHTDVATLKWEYGIFAQTMLDTLGGLREEIVALLSTLNPKDPQGEQAFKAAEFGMSKDERAARERYIAARREQRIKDVKGTAGSEG